MNRPADATDAQILELTEGDPAAAFVAQPGPAALLIHPEESLHDVLAALRRAGYGVFPTPDGRHYIAHPWRIEAERRQRAREERRARMTAAELADDDKAERRYFDELAERARS